MDRRNKIVTLSILVVFSIFSTTSSARPDDALEGNDLLNKCLGGRNHKRVPGPEDSLHHQCAPWTARSCCTEDTAMLIHFDGQKALYNFELNHCQEKGNMSEKCKRHFIQDHCFFECSPNVGPWLVKTEMKTRNETYFEVPLCASDCEAWFNDCRDDFTCTDNWRRNFDWKVVAGSKKRTNVCPQGSECTTFQNIFKTADNFCERVWDHGWKYTSDELPCMRIWFDGTKGNPNDKVAKRKVWEILNPQAGEVSGAPYSGSSWTVTLSLILVVTWLIH